MSRVLTVTGLCLSRGPRTILRGVDVTAEQGEVVALMGLSGSGKTTILKAVAGLEPIDAGEIAVHVAPRDNAPAALDGPGHPRPLRRPGPAREGVGMVFQFHYLFEHLSARDNVALAPMHVHGTPRVDAEARADALLDRLGVGHRRTAFPRELSGGEAQRVAIARALAVDPPLLLLDEPTASLDPSRREALGMTLRALAADGRTLVVASHDVDFVRDHAARVLILADGLVVEAGAARDVLAQPSHDATRALLRSAPDAAEAPGS